MPMMMCWAPASDKSPKRLTTCAGDIVPAPGPSAEIDEVLERRVLDLVRVAPDRGAMLGQDRVLAGDALGRAEDIAGIGVLGHEAQGLLLSAAADHDRDPGA